MRHQIIGSVLPVIEISLDPGEYVTAEAGALGWITDSIELKTMASGGFMGIFKRAAGGSSIFLTEYRAEGSPGRVAFANKVPGHILEVPVDPSTPTMIHRGGFLCATPGVSIGAGFQKRLGAGLFGGDGFILQKVEGQGTAWIELDGEVIPYELAPGESLRVHPGHVGMFQGAQFDITMLKGIKNMLFGGDGLFLAKLTGPGKIWLQSLPLPNLAHALSPYLGGSHHGGGVEIGGASSAGTGAVGGIIGGLLGGGDNS